VKTGKSNYIFLLIGMLALQFWIALAGEFPDRVQPDLIPFALVVTLWMGVWALLERRLYRNIGIVLAVVAGLAFTIQEVTGAKASLIMGYVAVLSFYLGSTGVAFTHVLFVGPVNRNKIFGVICVYLMLGMSWAIMYNLMYDFEPASFNGIGESTGDAALSQFVYFSFVTLSTLGYGDITPSLPTARFLAYAEATFGQFYIAIVVASLVSAYIAGSRKD